MDQLLVKINQLVIKTNSKQKTFVRSFVTKPSFAIQSKLGKIFGLIEIESSSPKISNLIDIIIEEIKDSYYLMENSTIEFSDLTEKFEKTLKKTNIAIASFIESEQITLDLDKINIVIGLIRNQELFLAQVGNTNCLLLYCQPNHGYRIINIIESTKSNLLSPDPLKLFSQVISGHIRPKDILFISTANLLDYFSQDRLKSILTTNLLAESIIQLKNLVEKINSKENFGALALELEKEVFEQIKVSNEELNFTAGSPFKESMAGLIRTERETEKFLTPTLLPEVKKIFINLKDLGGAIFSQAGQFSKDAWKKQSAVIKQTINQAPIKPQGKFFNKIFTFLKHVFIPFRAIFNITIGFIVYKIIRPLSLFLEKIKKTKAGGLINRYQSMPRSSQVLFMTTVILAILFVSSLTFLLRNNYNQKANDEFNRIVLETESKKNNAASSLIYRDENLARKLLLEAKETAADLKPNSSSQKKYLEKLSAEIEEQLKNMRHLVEIIEPVQLANFANLDNQVRLANFAALYKRVLYTQNLNNHAVSKVNLDSWVMSTITSPNTELGQINFGVISENDIYFINDEKLLFKLSTANDAITAAKFAVNEKISITDLGSFKNFIYILDKDNNQVYRLTKTPEGFDSSSNWNKAVGLDLKDATAIAVDGSVYILKNNGEIIRLSNGKPDNFKINSIDPPLQSPAKIKTTESSKFIYILEQTNKRVVVVSKETGNLVIQYSSPTFTDLKDISIDEADKKIFVLNNTTVLGIPADHLK